MPSVVIRYLQENETNGTPSITVTPDVFPAGATGLEYGALVNTMRLAGESTSYQKVPVRVSPIQAIPEAEGDDSDQCNWWRNHVNWLSQFSATRLNLVDGSADGWVNDGQNDDAGRPVDADIDDYPNELIRGALADWMGVIHARLSFTAQFTYVYPDTADDESIAATKIFGGSSDGTDSETGDQAPVTVTVCIIGTNAVTKTYAQLSGYTQAEPVPLGLAEHLYSALSNLQFQGSYQTVAQEVSQWRLGLRLNLNGGRSEWASMNALLQEIEDDLDEGRTRLKFGAAGHLTLQDLMERLRANRSRNRSKHIKERQNGEPGDDPTVNNTTNSPFNDGNTPPAIRTIPWLGSRVEQEPGDGIPPSPSATYDVLLGYGNSSFTGDSTEEIRNAAPIERIEIDVGNTASGWTGSLREQSDDTNAFHLISGDSNPVSDQLLIGASDGTDGGSVLIMPYDPSIRLSTNLNPSDDGPGDPFIHIDLSTLLIAIQDEDGATINISLNEDPQLTISEAGVEHR